MELQDVEPIFGEPKVEWLNRGSLPLHRFLFCVTTPDPSHLRFCVTDFHSNTWEASKSIMQLEDMRDDIGIGGDMSDFVNYITNSLKCGDVKLSMEGQSGKDGVAYAKLIAQKSKGMPVFSISLTKLVDSAAAEAIATLSLGLFNALRNMQCSLLKEQERSLQLTNMISAEKEKSESIQSLLGQSAKKQKLQNMNTLANIDVSNSLLSTGMQNSPVKNRDIGSTKITNRVVPAYRRAKTRGALLQESEDDSGVSDEKSESHQNQLQKTENPELQNFNTSANADGLQNSPDKHVVHDIGSTKITSRAIPVRRAKTTGAVLQDSEDDSGG